MYESLSSVHALWRPPNVEPYTEESLLREIKLPTNPQREAVYSLVCPYLKEHIS